MHCSHLNTVLTTMLKNEDIEAYKWYESWRKTTQDWTSRLIVELCIPTLAPAPKNCFICCIPINSKRCTSGVPTLKSIAKLWKLMLTRHVSFVENFKLNLKKNFRPKPFFHSKENFKLRMQKIKFAEKKLPENLSLFSWALI